MIIAKMKGIHVLNIDISLGCHAERWHHFIYSPVVWEYWFPHTLPCIGAIKFYSPQITMGKKYFAFFNSLEVCHLSDFY